MKKYVSCYSFWHSVATHLLTNHVDIIYIAKLLGHASLRTTQRYVYVEIDDLKTMHSRYHPRERSAWVCQVRSLHSGCSHSANPTKSHCHYRLVSTYNQHELAYVVF